MIDSFERDTLQYYEGDTTDYSINSERASDGSRSLYTGKNGYQTISTYEGDGLEPLPAEGDTVSFDIYPSGNQVTEVNLAYEGGGNRLVCALDSKRDEAYVSHVENSSWDNFLYASVDSLPQDEWLTVTLDWGADEHTFTLTVDDAAGTTLIDTTAQSENPVTAPDRNGMAFVVFGDTGAERWLDSIQILGTDSDGGEDTPQDNDAIVDGVPQPNSDGPFGLYDGEIDGYWLEDFADDFDQGALDTNKWGIGYGWGRTSDPKLEYVRDSDVWVDSGTDRLTLRIDRDDDYTMERSTHEERVNNGWYSGAVHSRDIHYQQHGYWEACIRIPEPVEGVLPAFWGKPNNEDWPPEIDFMERTGGSHTTVHTIHYDEDNKSTQVLQSYNEPASSNFHVFGCHWTPDYVEWYVDGNWVGRTTDGSGTSGRQLNYGQPYYMMISCHLWPGTDWLGDPEIHDNWPYLWECDWARVWSETDEPPDDGTVTVDLYNPYENVDWDAWDHHKIQYHTHTDHAPTSGHGGEDYPQDVIDMYNDAGFSGLCLTEHSYNVDHDGTTYPWTDLTSLDGGVNYANRNPDDLGMVSIEGCELEVGSAGNHLVSLYNGLVNDDLASIDDALTEIESRDGSMLFAHPGRYTSPSEYEFYTSYFEAYDLIMGIEILNDGNRYSDDRDLWDNLIQDLAASNRTCWGYAGDDYHGTGGYSFDQSYNVVLSDTLDDASIREGLENGVSYACYRYAGAPTVPTLDSVNVDRDASSITISASDYSSIEWISDGSVVTTGTSVNYEDSAVGSYVRAHVTSSDGEMWTQPFYRSFEIQASADMTVETENEDSNAVSGATVTVERTDSGAIDDGYDWPISSDTVFSGGDAVAVFEDIPTGTYDIDATHSDYNPATRSGIEHGTAGSRELLTLTSSTYDLEITVVDENSNPIAGATVGGDIESGETNSNGVYTVSVPDGDYTVAAEADDYTQESISVTVSGAPVSRTITLQSTGPSGAEYWDYTNSDGEIDFGSIPTGTYRLEAELDGYETHAATITHSDTGSSPTVRLVPSDDDPATGTRRISWSRESDWDSSGNERSGVANETDYLNRYDDDTLRLGFDPDHRPLSWSGRAWWPLSDMDGPVTDILGENNGTVNGATLGQGSILGTRAVQFEGGGTGDNITIPASSDLAWSGSFTIHALVRKETTASPICVIKNGFNEPGMIFLELRDNGNVSFGFYNNGGDVQYSGEFHTGTVGTGEWHHIVGVYDASQSQLQVYVDDINNAETLSVSGSRPSPPVESANDWGIGQRISNNDRDFAGYISNVGLFDNALSEDAIEQLLDATQGGELTTAGRTI